MIDASRSIKACAAYYGDNADAMESYLKDGEKNSIYDVGAGGGGFLKTFLDSYYFFSRILFEIVGCQLTHSPDYQI